jgi:hypothetical protein
MERVSKAEAIRRIRAAGFDHEVNELDAWRTRIGDNKGWDGWIRGKHPHVVAAIWPDEKRTSPGI